MYLKMKNVQFILAFFLIIYSPGVVFALAQEQAVCTHYVAMNGSDSNPGNLQKPWKSIQKAANSASAGNVVCVRKGVYAEVVKVNVSGSASSGYITFRSYPGEIAVLDGGRLTVPDGLAPMLDIRDESYIIVQNFEIRNYRSSAKGHAPVGVLVSGAGEHIQIIGNQIHHIETNYMGEEGGDAHGIAIYGTLAPQALKDIIISGNELYHLKLGSSEALVINGNVDGWQIIGNKVHHANNIGMDVIGFEGVSPQQAYDQARNGLISANEIYNIDSFGNPAYGEDRSAGCIYVDGGKSIIIEKNTAHDCNIGVELASENPGRATSAITVRNNFIYANTEAGIAIGGYDSGRGRAEDCLIINNTLFNNDTSQSGNGELMIQYDTRNNIIKNNIFYANQQKLFISSWSAVMKSNLLDFNLFYTQGGDGEWQWKNHTYEHFSSYISATGNDKHSLNQKNPMLVSTTKPDLHLQKSSPAIHAAENLLQLDGQDIDGQVRKQGPAMDIGADEVQ